MGAARVIQILGIREFYSQKAGKNIKSEVWFEHGYRAATVEDIFANGEKLIEQIPQSERWNVYYTVADCLEEKGRKLLAQHHIPFDVDGILVPEPFHIDPLVTLAKVTCNAIGVPFEKCGVLFSGNGVQIIVGTTRPISEVTYFDAARAHYKAICDRVDLALVNAGIQGKADRSVWSPARLMRMPGTENVKPGKPTRKVVLMNSVIERTDFTLEQASGIPQVGKEEQVPASILRGFPDPDVKAIMDPVEGCKFLHWCQTAPEAVSEAEWYAMLSITSRFPDGVKFSHQMSKGHPKYSYHETDLKIQQAIETAGPRTCKGINAQWGKCQTCKHFQTNLVSPIMIEGPDHVKTQKSGFYHMSLNSKGILVKGKPDFRGLQRFFNREFPYKSIAGAGTIWVWKGDHYEEMITDYVHKYAQDKFDPPPLEAQRREFQGYVRLENVVSPTWFRETSQGFINFANGYLEVKTGELRPHAMDRGFRSALACDYTPDAQAPTWERFIHDVTVGRDSLKAILQEYFGYILGNMPCHEYEKILMLLGEGSNGKSTLVKVLRQLTTPQGTSNISVKDMQFEQNRYLMEGKLVNIAEENSADAFRDTEFIKNFASGGLVRVKKVYHPPYEYENSTKLVMLCNKMPLTNDSTYGLLRKMILVPFDAEFTDKSGTKDSKIFDKLLAELPGIANWAIVGYKRLVAQGKFTESEEVEKVSVEYLHGSDSVASFVAENIEFTMDPNASVIRQEIYDHYVEYCQRNGLRPQSSRNLYNFMRARGKRVLGHPIGEKRSNKDGERHYSFENVIHLLRPKF